MAVDRAKEARKKAKASREASLKKSKGGFGRFLKGAKKAVKGVVKEVKEGAKGSKEYQAGKAKREKSGKWYPGKYAKKLIKGEDIAVPKGKKKAAAKKVAPQSFGKAFSSARKAGKKTFTWKGKSYTTKTADDVKKEKAAKGKGKTFGKEGLKKKAQVASKSRISTPSAEKQIAEVNKQAKKVKPTQPVSPVDTSDKDFHLKKMAGGGKVESNPYGWPTRDARNGGQK